MCSAASMESACLSGAVEDENEGDSADEGGDHADGQLNRAEQGARNQVRQQQEDRSGKEGGGLEDAEGGS